MQIRPPAVAGMFYPADPTELHQTIQHFLREAETDELPPKAMIVPHAGYIYSGPVAASAYARLKNHPQPIERVVLLGPSHRVGFYGVAAPSAEYFETPLGRIEVDREAIEQIVKLSEVFVFDQAHSLEHSLEVHLPFLQETLGKFKLVPLVVGSATADEVGMVLEALWGGPETLIVISSDLSHYLSYEEARRLDRVTTAAIEALDAHAIGDEQACGRIPIRGLLRVARRHGLQAHALDVRNSGDTAGPRDHVVGYGAYAFK
ncbi:MAG: AmmeMemoRadiSam system protein B [Gammaproteobacteria bacterium]|jgi:MEMO1 family protein